MRNIGWCAVGWSGWCVYNSPRGHPLNTIFTGRAYLHSTADVYFAPRRGQTFTWQPREGKTAKRQNSKKIAVSMNGRNWNFTWPPRGGRAPG